MPKKSTVSASPFLLLFRNAGEDVHAHLTRKERDQLSDEWGAWYAGLAAEGKVEHARPLAPNGRVVSGKRGQLITDGPFAETKEIVGGYFFIKVADLDEATAIAQQCPGLRIGLTVEVRPVAEVSPVLKKVRGYGPKN